MDWEKFRAETAARMLGVIAVTGWREMGMEKEVGLAIDYADELIKQLKNEKI